MNGRSDAVDLKDAIRKCWPIERWMNTGVVVGCSGGADSTALLVTMCETMRDAGGSGFIIAAHYNHGLRGHESESDQEFVAELARELQIRCVIGNDSDHPTSEADLRDVRLQFLELTACDAGARYVALAHNADDQVETFLHHLMRGTGPNGLTGIARHRVLGEDLVLVRPMLNIARADIRDSLQRRNQTWREDSSNHSHHYTRNWIRGELIPLVQSRFPEAPHAILRTMQTLNDWSDVIDDLAASWLEDNVERSAGIRFRNHSGDTTDAAIIVRALQMLWDQQGWPRGSMTHQHWQSVASRVRETSSAESRPPINLPGDLRLLDDGNQVVLQQT